jgi:hypothetical protein
MPPRTKEQKKERWGHCRGGGGKGYVLDTMSEIIFSIMEMFYRGCLRVFGDGASVCLILGYCPYGTSSEDEMDCADFVGVPDCRAIYHHKSEGRENNMEKVVELKWGGMSDG